MTVASPWWRVIKGSSHPTQRLFCFHHAGGSSHSFDGWEAWLPLGVEMLALQLPGRGTRLREPACHAMEEVVDYLVEDPRLYTGLPATFLGHSMGAHVAFALACHLITLGLPGPQRLVVSGARAPHLPRQRLLHRLADADLAAEICRMGGTPEAVLQDAEMLALTLPVLRADFEVCETSAADAGLRLQAPVIALAGTADLAAPVDDVRAWQKHAARSFDFYALPGGHFFLNQAQERIMQLCCGRNVF